MPGRPILNGTRTHILPFLRHSAGWQTGPTRLSLQRTLTSRVQPSESNEGSQPGQQPEQLPHISEEAAETSKITGETSPDLDKGTPIQEILERDPKAKESAPKVFKEDGKHDAPKGTRSYSTISRRRAEAISTTNDLGLQSADEGRGHIFQLPELPLKPGLQMKKRYDPMVEQLTKQMMRDGKLSIAQRGMNVILNRLRTAPPPSPNALRPLIPGSPSPSHLPLDPAAYLTAAVDSVAPLLRIKSLKGIAGGGAALPMPVPLSVRQRRRTAIAWILDAANKKADKGIGNGYANKIADEIIAIVEGRSSVWEKRQNLHRTGVTSRSNLSTKIRR